MDTEVFDENAPDDDLTLVKKEFDQNLRSIENAAFHDGFEETREKVLQKAFDTGYELIFSLFEKISSLEGIYDVLSYCIVKQNQQTDFVDIKNDFITLYNQLFAEFSEQIENDVESKRCMASDYSHIHIKPSDKIVDMFNEIKSKIIQISSLLNCSAHLEMLNNLNL